jgi:hypothetical protein
MVAVEKTGKDKAFDTEIGQKAIVEHYKIESDEATDCLREVIADVGRDLQRTRKVPPELEYVASFSVHVYKGALNNFAFAGVNSGMTKCPYPLADAALKKLRMDVEEYHRGRRAKLRSGF